MWDVVERLHKARKTEDVIACINGATLHGYAHPWMYTLLAMQMEKAGRPRDEIERVLMSTMDFSALNVSNTLEAATALARFDAKDRALVLYRQASAVDPTRLEPYALGLKLARDANDPEAVGWAAAGILQRAWNPGYEALHRDAEAIARDMEASLREKGDLTSADRLARTLATALERDLVIELSWSGKADLDLLVEEPSGAICSADNPTTTGGGIFTHDGYGGDQSDTHDNYVCPKGMPGDYRVIVRHISGEVVGKRARLRIVRYQGSPREIEDIFTTELSDNDKVVRVTLTNGRLKDLTSVPLLEVPRDDFGAGRAKRPERLVRSTGDARRAGAEFAAGRQRNAGGPGYQPVITVLPEGVSMTVMALISADRRYVRLTMQPMFSAISGVQSFSFISPAGSNPNNPGQPAGGGGAGGGGGGAGGGGGGAGAGTGR